MPLLTPAVGLPAVEQGLLASRQDSPARDAADDVVAAVREPRPQPAAAGAAHELRLIPAAARTRRAKNSRSTSPPAH